MTSPSTSVCSLVHLYCRDSIWKSGRHGMGAGKVRRSVQWGISRVALCGVVFTMAFAGYAQAADASEQMPSANTGVSQQAVTPEEELLGRIQGMGPVRIVMHSLEPADRLANQLSSLLAALGVSQIEQRIVEAVPESNQVRYYHTADREAGQVVGDALGLVFDEIAVRDFQGYEPVPSEGLIEVWLR